MVNYGNKQTFTNNFGFCEVSQVPLNPSDKRGKTREKIPSYLLPLSGELGDLGGWLCIGSVQVILKSTIDCVWYSANQSRHVPILGILACPDAIGDEIGTDKSGLATSKCQYALDKIPTIHRRIISFLLAICYSDMLK